MALKTSRDSTNVYQSAIVCNVMLSIRRYSSARLPIIRTSCDEANAEGLEGAQPALSSAALWVLAST